MSIELTGTVKSVGDLQTKGTFSFRNLILVTEEETKYPQTLEVQFSGNNADKLDSISHGEKVKVSINIRGKEYNDRIYVSLAGYQIQLI